ncbi:hypothetical protein MX551_002551 [Salmonella enterica]|uniref:DUF3279 domain-containing protein n=1 Tax=Salmonella diarizonae TaxID=59204 RepID=A0A6C8XXB9_SALDZ|nr:hypothetical protein [Salmonella enterica]ECI4530939.1 hypothetical protein [Salmonella enterica subsp. diarizonae]EDR1380997.1 hypothetical protein [Salmonella enterica subsp. diarizonae serovar 61:r:z53]EKN4865913.1 hypothetical protein [Yersinia enterocolitica]HCA3616654.1 hypothetical protein [Salmonella enterica subsp. diarizonae serovar 61:i:z]
MRERAIKRTIVVLPFLNISKYASEEEEVRQIHNLHHYVADAQPVILRADWHCNGCVSDYHGKRYCLTCGAGALSHMQGEAGR